MAAATPTTRFSSWALLLLALLALGSNEQSACARACPLYCLTNVSYMICPSSGSQKLPPVCNCCLAQPGCKLYTEDGTLICSHLQGYVP